MDLSFALPHGPQCSGLKVTQNTHFSLLTHTTKFLLVTFYYPTAETGVSFQTDGRRTEAEGPTDVEVEIVI